MTPVLIGTYRERAHIDHAIVAADDGDPQRVTALVDLG
jgi:hypothetical protein